MKLNLIPTRSKLIEFIAGIFILLFVYTALSKLANIPMFKGAINQSPLIANYSNFVAWGIPTVELVISILLFVPKTRKIGLISSLILMILFTGYLAYMIAYAPKLPCSCGGVISLMTWQQHLAFNILLTLLAGTAIFLSIKKKLPPNQENYSAFNPA